MTARMRWSTIEQGVHLNDSALCDDAEGGVRLTVRILLDPDDLQAECALELWVRHMRLLHTQPCAPGPHPWNRNRNSHHRPTMLSCFMRFSRLVFDTVHDAFDLRSRRDTLPPSNPAPCTTVLSDAVKCPMRPTTNSAMAEFLNYPAQRGLSMEQYLGARTCGSDESLVFGRLTSEAAPNKGDLCEHALPLLLLSLATTHDFEHFVFGDGPHL